MTRCSIGPYTIQKDKHLIAVIKEGLIQHLYSIEPGVPIWRQLIEWLLYEQNPYYDRDSEPNDFTVLLLGYMLCVHDNHVEVKTPKGEVTIFYNYDPEDERFYDRFINTILFD